MLCHWDDVPWTAHEHGDLRCERQRLGAAAGARDVGLSRYRIAPGCRAMPLHVHADEEEIFFVLAGSGFSWQDDALHEIRAGDVIVHRASEEAHTLVASDGRDARRARLRQRLAHRADAAAARGRHVGRRALAAARRAAPVRRRAAGAPSCRRVAPRPDTIVALDDVEAGSRSAAARRSACGATSAAPPARCAAACST